MKDKKYLTCKYLDSGMDGMLCLLSGGMPCKLLRDKKCADYTQKGKKKVMKDREIINEIKQDFKTHEENCKQIEEMAKDIDWAKAKIWNSENLKKDGYDWHSRGIATHLVCMDYCKIPKDSVVLSKSEYNVLILVRANYDRIVKDFNKAYDLGVKETAEKILKELVGHTFEDDGWTWTVSKEDIQWLADKHKVEINEGEQ